MLGEHYLWNPFFNITLIGFLCGVVGTFVYYKGWEALTGGMTHASFCGLGLGHFLGIDPYYLYIPTSGLLASFIGWMWSRGRMKEGSVYSFIWSFGMALGIWFISLAPGYAPDLEAYLFGSVLLTTSFDVVITSVIFVIVILTLVKRYRRFLLLSLDENYAQVLLGSIDFDKMLLLILISVSVTVSAQMIGLILVLALVTVPAYILCHCTITPREMILKAGVLGMIFAQLGFFISISFDMIPGVATVLVCFFMLVCFKNAGLKKLISSRKGGS